MSGHSKWASIKHKKAATDAKRGQLFTKLARAIAVAAREGGGDPDANFTLAAAIEKAKGYSMPKDNIQRAIDRGTGAGGGDEQIERVVYEGYGPGGAAILVEALTDNRNRTGSEVRHAFDKARRQPRRARARSPGSSRRRAWSWSTPSATREEDLLAAIDAGADDVAARRRRAQGDHRAGRAWPRCARRSRRSGVEVESAELAMEPSAVVEVAERAARRGR